MAETEAAAAVAALGLHLPPSPNTSEISPEFLRRHHNKKHGDDGSGDDADPLLYFCWRQQSCGPCLEASKACSWCPGVCYFFTFHLTLLFRYSCSFFIYIYINFLLVVLFFLVFSIYIFIYMCLCIPLITFTVYSSPIIIYSVLKSSLCKPTN